jgi:hypothetical protein
MTSLVISKPRFSITCHSGTIHCLLPKKKKKRSNYFWETAWLNEENIIALTRTLQKKNKCLGTYFVALIIQKKKKLYPALLHPVKKSCVLPWQVVKQDNVFYLTSMNE